MPESYIAKIRRYYSDYRSPFFNERMGRIQSLYYSLTYDRNGRRAINESKES